MEVKQQIIDSLKKAMQELGVEGVEPQLEVPADQKNGDYSTNIALVASKKLSKNPLELAQEIVSKLHTIYDIPHTFSSITAELPGFINFYLSQETLISHLDEIEKGNILASKVGHLPGKKVIVEFTDPNPFKEFHIGHLYSNAIGESISRLIESSGAQVRRVNYQGDVGLHVAKALYGMQKMDLELQKLEKMPLKERIELMGQAYATGSKAYDENEVAKQEIHEINKKVYEKDSGIMDLYTKGRQWSLEYFETIYQRLGTKFDGYYYESEVADRGIQEVSNHIEDGVFQSSEGAIIFPGKNYGLHNRVFINSLGLPTYEAKELGLAFAKYKDYPYDLSVVVTGNEISEYFKVLLKALSLIDPVLSEKTRHVSHGMVRLPSGKMSSRTGTIITGTWLLNEAKARIKDAFKDMDEETLEKVAVGAVKYSLLKSGIGKDVEFDFEESMSFEGNSGPYLQYTYVRTQSVLNKGKEDANDVVSTMSVLEKEETLLLRTLYQYPEIVEKAVGSLAPSVVCGYLFQLAHQFNLFYAQHSILESDNKNFRLALTKAVGKTLKEGLTLLGILTPSKM